MRGAKADREPPLLALRPGTGPARLQSVDEEAAKLRTIRALGLPADLFNGVPARVLFAYRRRVGVEELHELRWHPVPVRLTLLAAFCHVRGREITDSQHLMADRARSIPAICRELGDVPASTLYHYLHADGTLKTAGIKLLGAEQPSTAQASLG